MMKTYDLAEVWIRFTEKFSESASAQVMDTWINPIMPLEVTDEYCKVAVKNSFFKRFIEEKYSKTIESILSSIMEKNIRLIIEAPEQAEEQQTIPAIKVADEPIKPLFNVEKEEEAAESNLNPKYVFEIRYGYSTVLYAAARL